MRTEPNGRIFGYWVSGFIRNTCDYTISGGTAEIVGLAPNGMVLAKTTLGVPQLRPGEETAFNTLLAWRDTADIASVRVLARPFN